MFDMDMKDKAELSKHLRRLADMYEDKDGKQRHAALFLFTCEDLDPPDQAGNCVLITTHVVSTAPKDWLNDILGDWVRRGLH